MVGAIIWVLQRMARCALNGLLGGNLGTATYLRNLVTALMNLLTLVSWVLLARLGLSLLILTVVLRLRCSSAFMEVWTVDTARTFSRRDEQSTRLCERE